MIRLFFAFHEERQKGSSLFEGGNGANREQNINFRTGRVRSIYIFPPLGGIEFSPCHQGREKFKRKSLKSC
jgi:hypothetical protein